MPGDVVDFPREEPPFAWRCGCGCMTFYLRKTGVPECAACEAPVAAGVWTAKPPASTMTEAGAPAATEVVTGFGRSLVLKAAAGAKFVLSADASGKIKTWADVDAPDNWIRAILRVAETMHPAQRSGDDEVQPEPDEVQG